MPKTGLTVKALVQAGEEWAETARSGSGPCGVCICPNCGTIIAHQRGPLCFQVVYPNPD